jgi:hypothetical protein
VPIAIVLGIAAFLLSMKHEIRKLWNTLVIVLIWLNIGALIWRLAPPAHLILFSYWNKFYNPLAPVLHPIIVFGQSLVTNFLKIIAGLGV